MPTTITGVAGWPAITGPAGGDARNSASVRTMGQGLADQLAKVAQHVPGLKGSVDIYVPLAAVLNFSSRFTFDFNNEYGWEQTDVTDQGRLIFAVPLPPAGTITRVEVHVECDTGRAGLPATMPNVSLVRTSLGSGSNDVLINANTDSSPSLVVYETLHSWSVTLSHAIQTLSTYWLTFRGETGANSMANKLKLLALMVRVTE